MAGKSMIRVESVSKHYRIGRRKESYGSLRESITHAATTPYRWACGTVSGYMKSGISTPEAMTGRIASQQSVESSDSILALRDVSFRVSPGDVVGLVGRNGAGKSTLLKVLSRITSPTTGRIELFGRVGSLLEVGAGFHPELTGRENVFLSGAVLGMARQEIMRKFDEIVAFAELERLIDTPVKRYSSGLYMRLAFAVAAHLETDIMLVDEVLAVGDARFQKKCLGKLDDAQVSGRTVVFVSHNMAAIRRICNRAILLHDGAVKAEGSVADVLADYLQDGEYALAERRWPVRETAPGDEVARLHAVRVKDSTGSIVREIDIRNPFLIEVEYWNLQSKLKPTVSIHFINQDGICLFCTNDFGNHEWWKSSRNPSLVRAICRVPGNLLAEGNITVLAAVCSYNPDRVHAIEPNAVVFEVVDHSDGDGVRGPFAGVWPGVVRPHLQWDVTQS
jgi:lipopolysaccharide transport system ATP-binding protein